MIHQSIFSEGYSWIIENMFRDPIKEEKKISSETNVDFEECFSKRLFVVFKRDESSVFKNIFYEGH